MIEFTTPTFDEAIKFFRDKTPLTPDLYRKLTDEAKAKAFTVSGITRMDIVRDIYAAMIRPYQRRQHLPISRNR